MLGLGWLLNLILAFDCQVSEGDEKHGLRVGKLEFWRSQFSVEMGDRQIEEMVLVHNEALTPPPSAPPISPLKGWSKYSVGYFSSDGFKSHNYPFTAQSYGPAFVQGDVIGIGYRPRTGTVFFTRNGKKLEDAFIGLNRYNLFPTIGANGEAELHVNLGQAGFVFIEANVKKWGLAPMVGTRAPPPAYGMEGGSVLIEANREGRLEAERREREESEQSFFPPPRPPQVEVPVGNEATTSDTTATQAARASERRNLNRNRRGPSSSNARRNGNRSNSGSNHVSAPSRSSPLRRSVIRANTAGGFSERNASEDEENSISETSSQGEDEDHSIRPRAVSSASSEGPNNPPTPGRLDISLHDLDHNGHQSSGSNTNSSNGSTLRAGENGSYFPSNSYDNGRRSPSPPSYDSSILNSANGNSNHSLISRNNSVGQGVTNFANSVIGLLGAQTGLLNSNRNSNHTGSSNSSSRSSNNIPNERPPSFTSSTLIVHSGDNTYEATSSQNVQIENDLDEDTRENTRRNAENSGSGNGNGERRNSWGWGLMSRN